MLIFACAASRAVHLEVTKSQRAEEFKEKLKLLIPDVPGQNASCQIADCSVFRTTVAWIKKTRKSEVLQDY